MTRRDEFLHTHPDFHPGMLAFSDDGQELGEVQKLDEDSLTIEKGGFFSKDRRLPYDIVADIRADHLILNRSRADLEEWRTPGYSGFDEARRADVEEAEIGASVPIYQRDIEELERMETEHTPKGQAGPMPGGESFRDEEIRIPVPEEEVEVHKRPVAKGQARAHKKTRTEQPNVGGEVRQEDVKVERGHPRKRK